MKWFLEFIRAFFVSPEMLVCVSGVAATISLSRFPDLTPPGVLTNNDFVKHLALLPSAILIWVTTTARKVIFPQKDISNWLQSWPDYYKLKTCVFAAFTWNIAYAATGLFLWGGVLANHPLLMGTMLLSSVVGAGVVGFTVYSAGITINETFATVRGGKGSCDDP